MLRKQGKATHCCSVLRKTADCLIHHLTWLLVDNARIRRAACSSTRARQPAFKHRLRQWRAVLVAKVQVSARLYQQLGARQVADCRQKVNRAAARTQLVLGAPVKAKQAENREGQSVVRLTCACSRPPHAPAHARCWPAGSTMPLRLPARPCRQALLGGPAASAGCS